MATETTADTTAGPTAGNTSAHPAQFGAYAHWLLRFAMASVFIYYGVDKFLGGGIEGFSAATQLPVPLAFLVALTEIAAGILVLVGAVTSTWITRLGALLAVPVMLGAIFMVHWGQWHLMGTPTHPMGGMSFQVTLLLLATYIYIRGNEI